MDKKILGSMLNFAKRMKNLRVGKNSEAYSSTAKGRPVDIRSAEEIREIIENGNFDQMLDLSRKFLSTSGLYKQIISFYSNLLSFDTYTSVRKSRKNKANRKKYIDHYSSACYFADTVLNPQLNYPRVIMKALTEGAYYGVLLVENEESAILRDLPAEFCRSRKKNYSNVDIVELDMSYFNSLTNDEAEIREILKEFPREFATGYNAYLTNRQENQWFEIPEEYGTCFYFYDEEVPPLLSMIIAITNLNEYRNIEKDIDKQALEKILIQKIPLDGEGNFLLDTTESGDLHEGVVEMLRDLGYVDVLTTFADVKVESLGDRTKGEKDNLEKVERSVYNEAGVPQQLFSPDSVQGLASSIVNAMTFSLTLVKKIDNWATFHINRLFAEKNKYIFKVDTLPITHYNRGEMIQFYLNGSTFGYSKMISFVARGEKQSFVMDTLEFENDILRIHENMIPTSSSHTTAGGASTETKEPDIKDQKESKENEEVEDE